MMSSAGTILKKKGTNSTKSSVTGSNGSTARSNKRSPLVLVTVIAVSLALCATTQVLCSKLNKTILPPISLSLEDALEYLSTRTSDETLDAKYLPQYSNTSSSVNKRQQIFGGSIPAANSYALTIANSFLGYFFDELESGLDQVVSKSSALIKNTARFI